MSIFPSRLAEFELQSLFLFSERTTCKLINGADGIAMASQSLHVLCSQQLLSLETGGKKVLVDICCLWFVMSRVGKSCSLRFCGDV